MNASGGITAGVCFYASGQNDAQISYCRAINTTVSLLISEDLKVWGSRLYLHGRQLGSCLSAPLNLSAPDGFSRITATRLYFIHAPLVRNLYTLFGGLSFSYDRGQVSDDMTAKTDARDEIGTNKICRKKKWFRSGQIEREVRRDGEIEEEEEGALTMM